MILLEAEVHSSLRSLLRERDRFKWPHHLTMGRLVARALRLKRSSLIQTGTTLDHYCLSYLTPVLLADDPAIIVAPASALEHLQNEEIPRLKAWLKTDKKVLRGYRWPDKDFGGLLLTTPRDWLRDRLLNLGHFPPNILTLIDRAEDLEAWTVDFLTMTITPDDWIELIGHYPHHADFIRTIQAKLTRSIFSHPPNPYHCYLIDTEERGNFQSLLQILSRELPLDSPFARFGERMRRENYLVWTSPRREMGQFTLQVSPMEVASVLKPIWEQQPFVLMGGFLDSEKSASLYRQQHGIGELLTLKFSTARESDYIPLYLSTRLPLPNTPQFQTVLFNQSRDLINLCRGIDRPIILLIEDIPLKSRIGTLLAADYGSRVQVEKTHLGNNAILVCGWQFWQAHQAEFPTPQVLIIATLPFPSPENPLVAGRIAYHKRQHQDWFRSYLLPTAVREIQRSIIPLRESRGIVAIFDNRVNARSYGVQILSALEPYARLNYLDSQLLNCED